jgi:hypothetical protein
MNDAGVSLIRRAIEAVNAGSLAEVAPEIMAPNFARHDLAQAFPEFVTAAGVTDLMSLLRTSIADFQMEILDIFSAGDRGRYAMGHARYAQRGTAGGRPDWQRCRSQWHQHLSHRGKQNCRGMATRRSSRLATTARHPIHPAKMNCPEAFALLHNWHLKQTPDARLAGAVELPIP